MLPDDTRSENNETGRKSEVLHNQPIEGLEFNDIFKAKTGVAKATIKEKVLDTFAKACLEHSHEELKRSQEFDDLVGFPSDDETSKKVKNDVIDEINLNITTSENHDNEPKTEKHNSQAVKLDIDIKGNNNCQNIEDYKKKDEEMKVDEGSYLFKPNINENKSINHNELSNDLKDRFDHEQPTSWK